MNNLLLIVAALLLYAAAPVYAQEGFSFTMLLSPGDSLRQEGDLSGAVAAYKKNIAAGNIYAPGDNSVARSMYFTDIYNLACAFSRMGQQDSAVKYLERFTLEYKDSVGEALADPDFIDIRKARGWPKLETILLRNYYAKSGEPVKDMDYARKLWHMRAIDQAYYKDITVAEQKTGKTSTVVMALWDFKRKLNEENQRALAKLIEEKGWPKKSVVGAGCANTAFLVVQHADLQLQQKYLPLIQRLCKAGEAGWQEYALMYDRVQVSSGKAQRYGSQVHYNPDTKKNELFDLEDPAKVDQWRKELGLQPLAAYLKHFQIAWPEEK
jgi:tetratricopeptide (TPR) repeat protein